MSEFLKDMMSTEEVCRFFSITEMTLRNWRKGKYGGKTHPFPSPIKFRKRMFYKRAEVKAWAKKILDEKS